MTLEVRGWLRILEDLGIDVAHLTEEKDINSSRALRWRDGGDVGGGRVGVYFNRNHRRNGGVVYFSVHPDYTVETDWDLWEALRTDQVKFKERQRRNIYAKGGMERQALRQLLRR